MVFTRDRVVHDGRVANNCGIINNGGIVDDPRVVVDRKVVSYLHSLGNGVSFRVHLDRLAGPHFSVPVIVHIRRFLGAVLTDDLLIAGNRFLDAPRKTARVCSLSIKQNDLQPNGLHHDKPTHLRIVRAFPTR